MLGTIGSVDSGRFEELVATSLDLAEVEAREAISCPSFQGVDAERGGVPEQFADTAVGRTVASARPCAWRPRSCQRR